eukprot:PhM_4_TR5473/c0_g1_i1/m.17952
MLVSLQQPTTTTTVVSRAAHNAQVTLSSYQSILAAHRGGAVPTLDMIRPLRQHMHNNLYPLLVIAATRPSIASATSSSDSLVSKLAFWRSKEGQQNNDDKAGALHHTNSTKSTEATELVDALLNVVLVFREAMLEFTGDPSAVAPTTPIPARPGRGLQAALYALEIIRFVMTCFGGASFEPTPKMPAPISPTPCFGFRVLIRDLTAVRVDCVDMFLSGRVLRDTTADPVRRQFISHLSVFYSQLMYVFAELTPFRPFRVSEVFKSVFGIVAPTSMTNTTAAATPETCPKLSRPPPPPLSYFLEACNDHQNAQSISVVEHMCYAFDNVTTACISDAGGSVQKLTTTTLNTLITLWMHLCDVLPLPHRQYHHNDGNQSLLEAHLENLTAMKAITFVLFGSMELLISADIAVAQRVAATVRSKALPLGAAAPARHYLNVVAAACCRFASSDVSLVTFFASIFTEAWFADVWRKRLAEPHPNTTLQALSLCVLGLAIPIMDEGRSRTLLPRFLSHITTSLEDVVHGVATTWLDWTLGRAVLLGKLPAPSPAVVNLALSLADPNKNFGLTTLKGVVLMLSAVLTCEQSSSHHFGDFLDKDLLPHLKSVVDVQLSAQWGVSVPSKLWRPYLDFGMALYNQLMVLVLGTVLNPGSHDVLVVAVDEYRRHLLPCYDAVAPFMYCSMNAALERSKANPAAFKISEWREKLNAHAKAVTRLVETYKGTKSLPNEETLQSDGDVADTNNLIAAIDHGEKVAASSPASPMLALSVLEAAIHKSRLSLAAAGVLSSEFVATRLFPRLLKPTLLHNSASAITRAIHRILVTPAMSNHPSAIRVTPCYTHVLAVDNKVPQMLFVQAFSVSAPYVCRSLDGTATLHRGISGPAVMMDMVDAVKSRVLRLLALARSKPAPYNKFAEYYFAGLINVVPSVRDAALLATVQDAIEATLNALPTVPATVKWLMRLSAKVQTHPNESTRRSLVLWIKSLEKTVTQKVSVRILSKL